MIPRSGRIPFEVLVTSPCSAAENMHADTALLESLADEPKVRLHFYSWSSPSATYGYFIDPADYFRPEVLEHRSVDIARRPTGGGIIFHHCDLAYAVLIPAQHRGYSLNTLDNYAFINSAVVDAIKQFLGGAPHLDLLQDEKTGISPCAAQFCMAKPTKYDVLYQGRKVGGGAQRRTKYGLLHQGTISLCLPTPDFLSEILLHPHDVIPFMHAHSWPLLGHDVSTVDLHAAKQELQQHLVAALRVRLQER